MQYAIGLIGLLKIHRRSFGLWLFSCCGSPSD